MSSGRGRPLAKELRKPEPIMSPAPSVRQISNRRVNTERGLERESLLGGIDKESSFRNHGARDSLLTKSPHDSESDNDSIYQNSHQSQNNQNIHSAQILHLQYQNGQMNHSDSVNLMMPQRSYASPDMPGMPSISEYVPGGTASSLGWMDLLPYYIPMFSWIQQYCLEYFIGDLIGGISLATFQIPMAISYATSLAKVPISCGLYALGVAPLIYCLFGSVPQMITGPEAPISLIVGQAVEPLLHHLKRKNLDPRDFVVSISFVSGAALLGFGLGRFGFLDNILCDSLLKGFICGVGIVMVINSSIALLGLNKKLQDVINDKNDIDIHSPFDKVRFIYEYWREYNGLTLKVSVSAFVTILAIRHLKTWAVNRNKSKYRHAIYFPEILFVVVVSTVLCYQLNWHDKGLAIVGAVTDDTSTSIIFNPFSTTHLHLMRKLASSGLVCAMLGFFESTTALKSLGSRYDLPISSNRELVALGAINIACSVFGALPSFGGYGRSKINAISAKTTTSGAIMGIISLITVKTILPYLEYIPLCVLSVITAVIGISLISEGPPNLYFHWVSEGYNEIFTFGMTVLTTLFYSMEAGIAVGLIYLLIRVIKNSADSYIQILGRVPGTNTFLDADLANENMDEAANISQRPSGPDRKTSQLNLFTDNFRPLNYQALEEIEGCLIIKIPEPLTFTNTSDLRARLKRLEMYGSVKAHPALKRTRDASMTKYLIFDMEGMTTIDSSAAQILHMIILGYHNQGMKAFFIRVHKNRALRRRLSNTGITEILRANLKAMNYSEISGQYSIEPEVNNGRSTRDLSRMNYHDDQPLPVTESPSSPYFEHIRSALRVIDNFENLESSSELLAHFCV